MLVIGAELMSRVLDLDDRRTAGLFGDGAGAVVVTPGGAGEIGPVSLRADGVGGDAIVATQARTWSAWTGTRPSATPSPASRR